MLKSRDFLRLIRVTHWYKNILIFIPLIFSINLFEISLLLKAFLGFLSLCFISTSYYIINDLKDINKDKFHPEKKDRPLPSGRISKSLAIFFFFFFFFLSIILSYFLSIKFLIAVIILFVSSQIYTFWLRNIAFLDILSISINFIIRTISGVFLLNIDVSYLLIFSTFFLSIFLVSGKRISEINLQNIAEYRPSLNKKHKSVLIVISLFSMIILTSLFIWYIITYNKIILFVNLPISIYLMVLYFISIFKHPEKIRNPEKFIFDKKVIISLILWIFLLITSLYLI